MLVSMWGKFNLVRGDGRLVLVGVFVIVVVSL